MHSASLARMPKTNAAGVRWKSPARLMVSRGSTSTCEGAVRHLVEAYLRSSDSIASIDNIARELRKREFWRGQGQGRGRITCQSNVRLQGSLTLPLINVASNALFRNSRL